MKYLSILLTVLFLSCQKERVTIKPRNAELGQCYLTDSSGKKNGMIKFIVEDSRSVDYYTVELLNYYTKKIEKKENLPSYGTDKQEQYIFPIGQVTLYFGKVYAFYKNKTSEVLIDEKLINIPK